MSKSEQDHTEEQASGRPETSGAISFWDMLEERIVQLVRRIAALQTENAELRERLVERDRALKDARAECKRLNTLKKQMREKVERLIVKIEEYQEMAEKNELPKPPEE